jgi:hypothetical protein
MVGDSEMSVSIIASGLDSFGDFFRDFPEIAEQASVLAVNDVTARTAVPKAIQAINQDINFPTGYVKQNLSITRKARKGSIEAVVTARDRPTSLARFAAGQTIANTRGRPVKVEVKRGGTKVLKRGFLIQLKNGNVGLAVRVASGTLRESQGAKQLGANLFLLYGPSVEQVFKGAAADLVPMIGNELSTQFIRQFTRLSKRA